MLTTSEKIKLIANRKGISLQQLATMTGQTRQNFYNKLKRDNFPEQELKEIAKALGVGFESSFVFEDGEKL